MQIDTARAGGEPRRGDIRTGDDEKLGCTEIVSEDLNAGQVYHGMTALNPFKTKAADEGVQVH